jgi:hypothetical protein
MFQLSLYSSKEKVRGKGMLATLGISLQLQATGQKQKTVKNHFLHFTMGY